MVCIILSSIMQITVQNEQTDDLKAFAEKEWDNVDAEHYGDHPDWKTYDYHFVVRDNGRIVGMAFGYSILRVFDLAQLLVAYDKTGQGIGQQLMKAIESLCREKRYHKIILNTGKGWRAEKFYQKLGFQKVVELKNHYHNRDFILYEKFL